MKFKITLLLIIIAGFSILTFYGYPVIKSRYFSVEKKSITADPGTKAENTNKEIGETNTIIFESDSLKLNVLPADCDDECSRFKKDDELGYCKEVCGLSASEKTPSESDSCESKSGIQKDYCLKNMGISKKDFKICEQIQDKGVKKACKNRITEDIMDTQQSSSQ